MVAGTALACAVHTRSEGWALIVLALIWPISLAPAAVSRLRRTQRIVIVLAMIPAFLLVVNLTLLRSHSRWEWGRFDRLPNLIEWVQVHSSPTTGNSESSGPVITATAGFGSLSPTLLSTVTTKNTVWFRFLHEFCESFEYFNVIFLLVGLSQCRRKLLTREQLPMVLMSCGILLAVWIRLIQFGGMNGRYFLTALLIALPVEAMGVIYLLERIGARTARATASRRMRIAVPAVFVLGFVVLFWADALTSRHTGRQAQAALGSRLAAEHGPFRHVETDFHAGRVGHSAMGALPHIIYNEFQQPLSGPDLIIAKRPVPSPFRERAQKYGLTEIRISDGRHLEFSAFVRRSRTAATVVGSSPKG